METQHDTEMAQKSDGVGTDGKTDERGPKPFLLDDPESRCDDPNSVLGE